MDETHTTKKVFNIQPIGTRRKGRPTLRRIDGREKYLLVLKTKNWQEKIWHGKGFLRRPKPTLGCRTTEEGRKLHSIIPETPSTRDETWPSISSPQAKKQPWSGNTLDPQRKRNLRLHPLPVKLWQPYSEMRCYDDLLHEAWPDHQCRSLLCPFDKISRSHPTQMAGKQRNRTWLKREAEGVHRIRSAMMTPFLGKAKRSKVMSCYLWMIHIGALYDSLVSDCGWWAECGKLSANGVRLWQELLISNNWSKGFRDG
ncbi:hypothetical protein TNCV_3938241 [Trichonephila clavipes]|nr:hypothetical protein TNCV_3938241 [Trichonephila clavipes]